MKVRKHLREDILYEAQNRIRMATVKRGNGSHPVDDWSKRRVWRVRTRLDLWGGWRDVVWIREINR